MIPMSQDRYQPGVYTKGDQARICTTASSAVNAVYDGFEFDHELESAQVEPEGEHDGADQDPPVADGTEYAVDFDNTSIIH